jgi:hypothetical protein
VVAPTGARIPTNIATAELLVKYFEKKLADQPNIEGFEVKINQDGIPQAYFYAASAPAMSADPRQGRGPLPGSNYTGD